MINAVGILRVLSYHYYRNFRILQKLSVFHTDHSSDQDDAVHGIIFKQLQIGDLFLRVIVRAGEEHLVSPLREHLFDPGRDAADGFRIDLRHYDSYKTRLFRAQDPCLCRRLVPGLLDDLPDLFFLLFTDIAAV